MVVGGDPVDRHSSRDVAAASTVLRRSDLDSPGADAANALSHVPGVQIQRSGGGSDLATASLRGASSSQTPVYLAGIRLNDDLSGTADLSTVPLWMLDRIEIYRGHSPTELETTGIGGAVLFEPRYPKGAEVRGGAAVGSWGSRSVYGALGQGSQRASSLLALRRESSDNNYSYLDNGGTAFTTSDDRWVTRKNADQSLTDVWALSRLELSNSNQVLLLANAFDRIQGITGLAAIPAEHARAHVSRELFGASARNTVDCALVARCEISGATSFQRAAVMLDDPAFELGLGAPSLSSMSNRVAQRLEVALPLLDQVSFAVTGSASVETLDLARPGLASLDATRHEAALGPSVRWMPSQGLTLLGAAHFETQATRSMAQVSTVTYPTGRLGGALTVLKGWQLMANWGDYVRPPTLGELYGTSATVSGNSALQAEKGLNRDLGTRILIHGGPASLALDAYAFRQDVDKLVGWQRSSFGQITPYNVGEARLQGVESSLALELFSTLHAESAVTLLDPRDTSPGRTLKNDIIPYRSRLVADVLVEFHTQLMALGLTRAGIFARGAHRSSRYEDAAGLIIIPHSTTYDFGLSAMLASLPVSIRATAYNVFNQLTFDVVGYPLPPRTLMVSAELDWERRP